MKNVSDGGYWTSWGNLMRYFHSFYILIQRNLSANVIFLNVTYTPFYNLYDAIFNFQQKWRYLKPKNY